MPRRAVRFKVSGTLLSRMMGMPEETLIFNIKRGDYTPDVFEFIVEHPDLPEVPEGGLPIENDPLLTLKDEGPREWIEWDWNLPEDDDDESV